MPSELLRPPPLDGPSSSPKASSILSSLSSIESRAARELAGLSVAGGPVIPLMGGAGGGIGAEGGADPAIESSAPFEGGGGGGGGGPGGGGGSIFRSIFDRKAIERQ